MAAKFEYGDVVLDLKTMRIEYDGKILPETVCADICRGYERMATAKYLMDEHGVRGYVKAFSLAEEVRDMMDDYGISEDEAIDEIL